MKDTVRTFVAIETSIAVQQRAAELIGIFAATGAKVSWVKPHNLHLTLKFLDEVPLRSIPEVGAAVQEAAAGCEPFGLEICTAGAFPNAGRPRTLWLGTGQGSEPLGNLHAALENCAKADWLSQRASPLCRASDHWPGPRPRSGIERTRSLDQTTRRFHRGAVSRHRTGRLFQPAHPARPPLRSPQPGCPGETAVNQ